MQLLHRVLVSLTFIGLLSPLSSFGQTPVSNDWIYVVQPNDTLIGISRRHLLSASMWVHLQTYNQLKMPPDKLPADLALRIPNAWRRASATSQASVEKVTGTVYVTSPHMPEQVARVGTAVAMGSSISTGSHSSAVLRLADSTQINVWPRSKLLFEKLQAGRKPEAIDAVLNLSQGEVRLSVPRPPNARKNIRIQTPSAVAAVQGTKFWVSSQPERTLAQTYEGQVQVQAQGRNALVGAAQEVSVRLGEPPSSVQVQRGVPVIENLTIAFNSISARVSWSSPTVATQWRVLIAKDLDFEELVHQVVVDEPQIDWLIPSNGRWWIRIQALNEQQMPSQAYAQFFDVQVPRDYLGYVTIDDVQQRGQLMRIELPELQTHGRYLLQLSRDIEGKDVIWSRVQSARTLSLPTSQQTATQYLHIFRSKGATP
jgi:FecR protein